MSQQNVEIVEEIYEQVSQGHTEVLYERLDPKVEWDTTTSDFPDAGLYHGHDGVREYRRRFWGTWEAQRNEPEELIDAGDSVVAVVRMGGRGKGSGIEIDQWFAWLWTFSEGKVIRVAVYQDRAEALEAAGLSQQDAHTDS